MKISAFSMLIAMNVVALGIGSVLAGEVTIPNDFEAHTAAVADEVNENFDAVADAINDNDDRLDTMSSGYVSVSAVTAIPQSSTFETGVTFLSGENGIGRYAVSTGSTFLIAPVFLPDGATILSLSYTCYDNDATYDSGVWLYRDGTSDWLIAGGIYTSSSSTTAQTVTATDISNPIVDNSLYGYHVYMSINGSAGSNLAPIRVVIEYTLD